MAIIPPRQLSVLYTYVEDSGQIGRMWSARSIFATVAGLAAIYLAIADFLDRANKIYTAPGTATSFAEWLYKMLSASATPEMWLALALGASALVVTTSDWWWAWLSKFFASAPASTEEQAKPALPNKYVCVAAIAPKVPGRYALIIEFGVREKETNGFSGSVVVSHPYVDAKHWEGPPLHTDAREPDGMWTFHAENRNSENGVYAVQYRTPNLTPRSSAYIYLESEHNFSIRRIFFLEDVLLLTSEPTKADKLAAEFGDCPR